MNTPFTNDPSDPEMDELSALLADPSLWDDLDESNEDAIVAAIMAEAGDSSREVTVTAAPAPTEVAEAPPAEVAEVIPLAGRARRWLGPAAVGIAAALAVLVGGSVLSGDDVPAPDLEVALGGTDNAPAASAVAAISETPQGTLIVLDVVGLEPAPAGTYYEAWLRKDAEIGVSAGTFHLRGGEGAISLWAGVTPADYPLLTVTIQDEAQVESSGIVVLKARLDE